MIVGLARLLLAPLPAADARVARLYAQQSPGVRAYVQLRLRLGGLADGLVDRELPESGVVADIGCGFGLLANRLALSSSSRQVLGIEWDSRRLGVATATQGCRSNVQFIRADLRAAVLPPLDGAVITEVLHHLVPTDQDRLLGALADAIRPGGRLLVREVDPSARPRWRYWASYAADAALYPDPRSVKLRFRRPDDLSNTLRRLGFEVTRAPGLGAFASVLYICVRIAGTPRDDGAPSS